MNTFEIFAVLINTLLACQNELFSETLILLMQTAPTTRKMILEAYQASISLNGSIWEYWFWFAHLGKRSLNGHTNFTSETLFTLGTGHRLQQTFFLGVCNSRNSCSVNMHLCDDAVKFRISKHWTLPRRICICSEATLAHACANDFDYLKRYFDRLGRVYLMVIMDITNKPEIFEYVVKIVLSSKYSTQSLLISALVERFIDNPNKSAMLLSITKSLKQQS